MLSLIEHTIQITIIDDSKSNKCDINCGLDWSSAKTIALASQQVKDRFGDKIQLEYLDLSKRATNRHATELKRQVKAENLSLPLLLVNGKTRISGQFDIRLLLDAIDAEMEITLHCERLFT